MDAADRAQAEQDVELATRLEEQKRGAALDAPGAEFCADCREPIPEERRRAMPSADRCVGCQAFLERIGNIQRKNGA